MDKEETNSIFTESIEENYPPVNTTRFKSLTSESLTRILGLSIKRDDMNKLITFLVELSAYTEDSQINLSFNAPSSTGKSYIPLEIAKLFPQEDLIKLGNCSPTAFYHEQGIYDKERNVIKVDLSRKILIFLDQPSNALLTRLRSLLSHDEKEIQAKITDKNQKGGNRTKTVIIKGFPSVIFCTAGLNLDEQEATRFLLLSPEITEEKIREAIYEKIKKESDSLSYSQNLEINSERKLLKERILAIKEENIHDIKIFNPKLVEDLFFVRTKLLKPRHQRDIARITSLIKIFALLNLWFRKRDISSIEANNEDIKEAFKIWDSISESQELNLSPYVYNLYRDVIVKKYNEKNNELKSGVKVGLTRQEVMQKHFEVYRRFLPDWQLRQQVIPPLETAGLIIQEPDITDRRKILIYPTTPLTISKLKNNSELQGGVETVSYNQLDKVEKEYIDLADKSDL